MSKIESITHVLLAHGGSADWASIEREIGTYYKGAKFSLDWKASFRCLINREIRHGRTFKKVGDDVFALK